MSGEAGEGGAAGAARGIRAGRLPRRLPAVLAAVLVCVWLAAMWSRIGVVPAASTGDELWYGEAAYWLVHDGVLRRDIHDDALGSAVRDFLPPTASLGTAAAFALFGVNRFSVGLLPAVLLPLTALALFLAGRRAGLERPLAAAGALAFVALPETLKIGLRTRPDVCTGLFLALAAAAALAACRDGVRPRTALALWFATGVAVGAASVSYYAAGPLAVAYGLALALACPPPAARGGATLALLAGGGVALAGMALWIAPDWALFLRQNLGAAAGYDWAARVAALGRAPGPAHLQMLLIAAAAAALAMFAARAPSSGPVRRFAVVTPVFALLAAGVALAVYPNFALYASTLAAAGALAVAGGAAGGEAARRLARTGLVVAAVAAVAAMAGTAAVGWQQRGERDYARFERTLLARADLGGIVLSDHPGWLALRPRLGAGRLHHLILETGSASDANASRILFDAAAAGRVSSLIARPERLAAYRRRYPLVAAFLARPDVAGPIPLAPAGTTYAAVLYTVRAARAPDG